MADSGLVATHNQESDTNVGSNLSHNDLGVAGTVDTVTTCGKENIVEKAKKHLVKENIVEKAKKCLVVSHCRL